MSALWAGAAAVLLVPAPPLLAAELGHGELRVAGTRLVVSPESQTVPFDTPTVVETALEGFDLGGGSLPAGLRVLADFTGPEIGGVLPLETVPGEPFAIPRLRLEGEYRLENVRLLQGSELLAWGRPRSAVVRVTQVLVTRVTSRPLTLDEIRSYGIVVSDDSFRAFNFTFGFGVAGGRVDYNLPVVFQPSGEVELLAGGLGGNGGTQRRFRPPQLAPFRLDLVRPEPVFGGCQDPGGDCSAEPPPPVTGVLLFPTDLGLLNQFFSVVLVAGNGAPEGDPLVIRDLTARVTLPPGLRQARTEPPTPLGVPVPVRVPGPDGEVGTADDLTFLVAQATGEAELVVEGLKEGTHVVEIGLEGILEGLPGGIQRIAGRARGAVLVRDPTFGVTLGHPDVVRAGEEYSLFLTLSNTSTAPANLVTLALPLAGLSGVEVVGPRQFSVDTLPPGGSEVFEFRLRSLRTGRVVAASARSDRHVHPTFELRVGVGEGGAPLAPNAIVLPRAAAELPRPVVESALALVGLGSSLATAPPALLAPELPRVGRERVDQRVYELAQAGRHLRFGEEAFDALAVLAAEWNGARDGDLEWDRLRRGTAKGGAFGHAVGQVLAAYARSASPRSAFERWVATTAFLPPQVAALAEEGSLGLELASRASSRSVAGSGVAGDRLRDLPFADLYDLGGGEMAVVARPEEGGYRVRLQPRAGAGGGSGGLRVLLPDGQGRLRVISWSGVSLTASGGAEAELVAGGAGPFELAVDADGDGLFENRLPGSISLLSPRPFTAVAAVQNSEVDPTGHVVEVLFSQDVDLAGLAPADPERFTLPGKVSNGGLIPAEEASIVAALGGEAHPFAGLLSSRVVRVIFDNPLSPYREHLLTVRDVSAAGGDHLSQATVPVTVTATLPGTLVAGRVIGADGRPAPFAVVELVETDECPLCIETPCVAHKTAAVQADAAGEFLFDYVRRTPCGDLFSLRAADPATGKRGGARGRVRFLGETVRLDVVMRGRGTVRGRVLYDDGTPPDGLVVQAVHPALQEGRLAVVDEAGNYQVGDLPVGTVVLAARDRHGNTAAATVELPAAGAVARRDLTLLRRPAGGTGEVRGTVYAPDGTSPVRDAWVALYGGGELVAVQVSSVDGRFAFGPVPAGPGEIEAFSGETGRAGARLHFEILPDRLNQLDVLLRDERGTVEGRVLRESLTGGLEPVAMATVWAAGTPFNTVTGGDGSFRLEGVFAGLQTLHALDPESRREVTGDVTVLDGETARRDLVVPIPADTGAVAGEVLDAAGNPVPFATVHRALSDQQWQGETFTDGAGRFTLEGLAPGVYSVHAFRGEDGGVATAEIRFPGDTPFVTLRFRRGSIRGQVLARDEAGELVGVPSLIRARTTEVRLGLVGLALTPTDLETDAEGRFELTGVLAGPYVLTAFHAFHGEETVRGELVSHGQVVEHRIVFEANGTVTGRVLGHDGVTPAAGARVQLRHPAFSAYDVTADAEGRFTFDLVPPTPRPFPVDALLEEGMILRRARVWARLDRPGQELAVEIVLPRQGSVSGRVEDASGAPVPGAQVTLKESEYPSRTLAREADATGAFQFHDVFAGVATLAARAPALGGLGGKVTVEVVEEGQEIPGVVIRLQETGEITGRVTSPVDGSAVPSADVRLYRGGRLFESLTAGAGGELHFTLLPLGTYELRVFDPASGRAGRASGVLLAAHGQVEDRTVVLEGRGTATGHLYEPASSVPVPGATVSLRTESLVRITTYGSTAADGAFLFDGVPQGPFTLTAREPDGRRRASGSGEIAGEDDQASVDLYLEAAGAVTGTALNPLGSPDGPFTPVNVVLRQDGEILGASLEPAYRFEGVIAGRTFTLSASEPGGLHRGEAAGRLDVQGQVVAVDVRMEPLGGVEVMVEEASGAPVTGADVRLTSRGFYPAQSFFGSTGESNAVFFPQVGAGALSAFATHPVSRLSGSATGTLSLEGERVRLMVRLQEAGEIRGTVLLADGVTPAAGALAALATGTGTYTVQAQEDGSFHFPSVPLGSFVLDLQEHQGPGVRRLRGRVDVNGQVVELGALVLDDLDPRVVAVEPADGAAGVGLDARVVVRFSEPVDAAAFDSGWIILRRTGGDAVPATPAFSDGGTTVTLTPDEPLASFTAYQVRVTSAVTDPAGRHLAQEVQTGFTTADLQAPEVVSVFPADGAVQVPLEVQPVVELSEAVEEASLSGSALQLTDLTAGAGVTTTFTLQPGGRRVLLTPAVALAEDHTYQLTVQGLRDLAGNVMAEPFVSRFLTVDATPPVVELTAPDGPLTEGVTYLLAAAAVDSPDLAAVSFFAGESLLATDEEAPWETVYVPSAQAAAAGMVELAAVGRDRSGNFGPASTLTREVTADLPPELTVAVEPASEILPGGALRVSGNAADATGLGRVRITLSGALTRRDDLDPASATSYLFDRVYTLPVEPPADFVEVVVQAVDELGKITESAPRRLAVLPDVEAPFIEAVEPPAGSAFTAGDPVPVSAQVTDDVAVASVTFRFAGESFTVRQAPWAASFTAPAVATSTLFDLEVEAADHAGNRSALTRSLVVEPLFDPDRPTATILCPADGDRVVAGQTVSVAFRLSDDDAVEGYTLTVAGEVVASGSGVNQPLFDSAAPWTVPAGALPGDTFPVRLEVADFGGNLGVHEILLEVPGGTVVTGDAFLDASYDGQDLVLAGGTFTATEPLAPASLTLTSGARLVPAGAELRLTAAGAVRVQCDGAAMDASDRGFAGGALGHPAGYAPAGLAASQPDAGGSHGGAGGVANGGGPAGEVYGSVYRPLLAGGGGAIDEDANLRGGFGGGAVEITAAEVILDGEIAARGERRPDNSEGAGGAGGSVLIRAGRLAGAGRIDASGAGADNGSSSRDVGPGGGGRVTLWVDRLDGFDPARQVEVRGGRRRSFAGSLPVTYGAPGTLHVAAAGASYGSLLIDAGEDERGDRVGPATRLPALGAASLTAFAPQGQDAWVTGPEPFRSRWLGAWMVLLDGTDGELGRFQVTAVDPSGQALLAGAGAVDGAASYRGEYRFDRVELRHGAGLAATDPVEVTELVLGGASTVSGPVAAGRVLVQPGSLSALALAEVEADEIRLLPGATVTAPPVTAVPGGELRLAARRLVVEAGAVLEASGQGYAGGTSDHPAGLAPAGLVGSLPDAGGSHGGAGSVYDGPGPAGQVYGSLFEPALGGGGGARDGRDGVAGGGVVELVVVELVLDGEVRARGLDSGFTSALGGAAGAGGSVIVRAGVLSGGGRIDASGGYSRRCNWSVGSGGGGRVALLVDALSGFDPAGQVSVAGGGRFQCDAAWTPLGYAASGTLYVQVAGDPPGDLYVDQGGTGGLAPPPTVLPAVGSGTVGAVEADPAHPADLWIEAAAPASPLFDHGVVGMTVQIDGTDRYRVKAQSPDRARLLLAGAAGRVQAGDRFEGICRFDRVVVSGGAILEIRDIDEVGEYVIEPGSEVLAPSNPQPEPPPTGGTE